MHRDCSSFRRPRSLITLALLLVGCAHPSAESPPSPERPLRVATYGVPLGLDPHLYNEHLTWSVLGNVYDSLVRYDGTLTLQPRLALDWDNPSPTLWRFRLRRGVVFQDGTQLDSRDVVFSLLRARDHPRSQVTGYLVAIEDVRALDDYTIEVETRQPFATMLNKLAFVAIVPEEAPAEILAPIGSGPYRIDSVDPGERIALEAFDGYWGPAPPEQNAEFLFDRDDEDGIALLLSGEVDLLQGARARRVRALRKEPSVELITVDSLAVEFLEMRTDRPPLDDLRVRQAIDLALDRDALVEEMLAGYGVAIAQLFPQHVVGHLPDRLPARRNVSRAKRLLEEAGYPGGVDLEMEIAETSADSLAPLVTQLAQADIRLELVPRQWDELLERFFQGRVVLHLGAAYAESADASDVLDEIVHTPDPDKGYGAGNAVAYSNPIVDELIEKAGTTLKTLERREYLQECHARVLDDLAFIPLLVRQEIYLARRGLVFEPRLDALIDLGAVRRGPRLD